MRKLLAITFTIAAGASLAACSSGSEIPSSSSIAREKLNVAAELDAANKTGYACVINNEQGNLVESFGSGIEERSGLRRTFRVLGDASFALSLGEDLYTFVLQPGGAYPEAILHAKSSTDARELFDIPTTPSSCLARAGEVVESPDHAEPDERMFGFKFKDGDSANGRFQEDPGPAVEIGTSISRVQVIVNVIPDHHTFWGLLGAEDAKAQAKEAPLAEVEALARLLVSRAG